MTDQIREQMSALLDGELAPGELGLLVRRMERDAELRRAFGNYVLAGESMRAPGGITASPGFATRVSAALDDGEVVPNATPARAPRAAARFKRPLAGVAVAAGAALSWVSWRRYAHTMLVAEHVGHQAECPGCRRQGFSAAPVEETGRPMQLIAACRRCGHRWPIDVVP